MKKWLFLIILTAFVGGAAIDTPVRSIPLQLFQGPSWSLEELSYPNVSQPGMAFGSSEVHYVGSDYIMSEDSPEAAGTVVFAVITSDQ